MCLDDKIYKKLTITLITCKRKSNCDVLQRVRNLSGLLEEKTTETEIVKRFCAQNNYK